MFVDKLTLTRGALKGYNYKKRLVDGMITGNSLFKTTIFGEVY